MQHILFWKMDNLAWDDESATIVASDFPAEIEVADVLLADCPWHMQKGESHIAFKVSNGEALYEIVGWDAARALTLCRRKMACLDGVTL